MSTPEQPAQSTRRGADGASDRTPADAVTLQRDAFASDDSLTALDLGRSVGRFVLLQRLGRGGMGVVHAAYDPELDRKVAIKLVVTDSAGDHAEARLVREAQAMAKLSHPNVAHVYEVGPIERGIYIAMEFIDGRTLGAWAAERARDWREIVDVFVAAGQGIAAAHDAGLVHRDIKPDNIMIDRRDRVRVLDFGLATARAMAHDGDDANGQLDLTAPGALMGTPRYMAPEQFARGPVDRRADVYAFCVALWEMLYGVAPVHGRSLGELAENVIAGRIVDPEVMRGPAWLSAALRRGLARVPEARWDGMRPLLAELTRDRRAPLRRALAIAVPVAALVIGATLTAGWIAPAPCTDDDHVLDEAWDDDDREAVQEAFAATEKPWADHDWPEVEADLDGYAAGIRAMRLEACQASRVHGGQSGELLDRRMTCLDLRVRRLGGVVQALAAGGEATIERAADVVAELPAIDACADVEDLMRAVALPEDAATRASVIEIGGELEEVDAQADAGRFDGFAERLDDLLARARATGYDPIVAEVLLRRGHWELHLGRDDAAEVALYESLELAERSGHDVFIVRASLGAMRLESLLRGRFDIAEVHARHARSVLRRLGDPPEQRVRMLREIGRFEMQRERPADGLAALEEALAIERQRGIESMRGAMVHREVALALLALDRPAEAEAAIDRAFEIAEARHGPGHPDLLQLQVTRARLRRVQGRHEEAIALYRAAADGFARSLGEGHMNGAAARNGEGLSLADLGRDEEAIAAFEAALAIIERELGWENQHVAAALNNLGTALTRVGRAERAIEVLQRALDIKRARFGPRSSAVGLAHDVLGDAHLAAGDLQRARAEYNAAIAIFTELGGDIAQTSYGHYGLGRVAAREGDRRTQIAELERALELDEDANDPLVQADIRHALAVALAGTQDDRAAALEREARQMYAALGTRGAARLAALPP